MTRRRNTASAAVLGLLYVFGVFGVLGLLCTQALAADAPALHPLSVTVTATGAAFPKVPHMHKPPSAQQGPPPERAARRAALTLARHEALGRAVYQYAPDGPGHRAFLLAKPWIERMQDAYLEAVQVTHEETDALGAIRLTVSASVRLADMLADAQILAPRQTLANHPAVRVETKAAPPARAPLDRLAQTLRQELARKGIPDQLHVPAPSPIAPLRLMLRPATPAETNGKGQALALELLGFRDEPLLFALCPGSPAQAAQSPCAQEFTQRLLDSLPQLWSKQLFGPFILTLQHQGVASEDRAKTLAKCLGDNLPGARGLSLLHFGNSVATYRLNYAADPALLDQELGLNGMERLCGDFGVERIEGETVVLAPRPGH